MGSEVAKQSDQVAEGNAPSRGGNLGVDLADPQSVRSVFGYNPEVGKSGNQPEIGTQGINDLSANPANILGPAAKAEGNTLPGISIVENGRVVADGEQLGGEKRKVDGAAQGPQPPSDAGADQSRPAGQPPRPADVAPDQPAVADRPHPRGDVVPGPVQPADPATQLKQNTLDASKIRKREGYFQVADRLLGDGFNSDQKKELTSALRDSWKANPANGDPNLLHRGDQLLTQNNLDPVLNSIKDPGLRERMRERLTTAELAPSPEGQTRRTRGNPEGEQQGRRQSEAAPDREAVPDRNRGRRQRGGEATPDRDATPDRGRREQTPPSDRRGSETPPDPRLLNPEPTPQGDRSTPEGERQSQNTNGPLKSPFLRRYEQGDRFQGQTSVYWQGSETASGLPFNKYEMTAASKEFPFGTVLRVTNPDNGREVRVVVTDHGPFAGGQVQRPDGSGTTHRRVLDISLGAANALGMGKTVKPLEIAVDSLPEQGKWGSQRRNIHGDYRRQVQEDVRRLSRRA